MSTRRKISKNISPSRDHLGLEETPREIVNHGHYGFWLSPNGRCFVVNRMYSHGPIAAFVAEDYYGRYIPSAESFLEEQGWARVGGLPIGFTLFTDFISRGRYRPLEMNQVDTLFDLQLALPSGNARRSVEKAIKESLSQIDMQINPKYKEKFLYHGTSAKQRFEEDGETPTGPAWFSDSPDVAEWFSKWHEGPCPRVLKYSVLRKPNLFKFNEKILDKWAEEQFGETSWNRLGIEDLINLVSDAGYDGWIIPDNYPEGADIMIIDPGSFLEFKEVV